MKKSLLILFLIFINLISLGQKRGSQNPSNELMKLNQVNQLDSDQKSDFEQENYFGSRIFVEPNGEVKVLPEDLQVKCGFVEEHEKFKQRHALFSLEDNFEGWMRDKIKENRGGDYETLSIAGPRCDVYYIPYVVHVLHPGEPVNTVDDHDGVNISASQVQSQIDRLNQTYRKLNFNRNESPQWDGESTDFKIEFVPVLIDPESRDTLPEPGINRVDLIAAGYPTDANGLRRELEEKIKPETIWDSNQIFNIWICDIATDTGLLGYAQFPGQSGLGGLPGINFGETDGVVCDTYTFQYQPDNDGSFSGYFEAFKLGGTAIHETGHWVGLRHIWGDGNCTFDDYVSDTPIQGFPSRGCPVNQDSCNADDLPDMIENFMDYANDECTNLFTKGQAERKDVVFQNSPRRGSLLYSEYADYKAREPYILIEVEDLEKQVNESEGCIPYADYVIRPRIKDCTNMQGTPTATIVVNDDSTATEGEDYEFLGPTTVTFSGSGPEVLEIPIRIYSDNIEEGTETLIFDLEIDAGGSDATIYPIARYTQAIWEIEDAIVQEEAPSISYVYRVEDFQAPLQCGEESLTLTIEFDEYPDEVSWNIVDTADNIVESGGDYGSEYEEATLDIPLSLDEGSYTLNFFDSYDDGFSTGGYKLIDSENYTIVSGGTYTTMESNDFCFLPEPSNNTFSGILPLNYSLNEIEKCSDFYSEYMVAMQISGCVVGGEEITATISVNTDQSDATEGQDFEFPMGKSVTFSGEGDETLLLPIRFLSDDHVEGNESLVLEIDIEDDRAQTITESVNTLTIIDTNTPTLAMRSDSPSVYEKEYGCEGKVELPIYVDAISFCNQMNNDVTIEVTVSDESTVDDNDYSFIGETTHTFTSENIAQSAVFNIEVEDDMITEVNESIIFELKIINNDIASVINSSLEVIINDPLALTSPTVTTNLGFTDFEGGIPDGWVVLYDNEEDTSNGMTLSTNTRLDNMAAHISSDPDGTKQFDYVNFEESNTIYMLSPKFIPGEEAPFDLDFQAFGEVGVFIFDTALLAVVDGTLPVNDYTELFNTAIGTYLYNEEDPITLTDYMNNSQDIADWYAVGNYPGPVRLIISWTNDNEGVFNPPLAVDNINLNSVETSFFVETYKMIGDQKGYYELTDNQKTYFYNVEDNDIALSIQSTENHDCTTGYVNNEGTGTQKFISEIIADYAADKTFVVETDSPDKNANLDIELFYTEEELKGWEEETGNTREDLRMFKTYDYALKTCFNNEIKLEIGLDSLPDETSWEVKNLLTNEIVYSGGDYTEELGVVNETFTLPDGDYLFAIKDSFNDGICCLNGDGYYTLTADGEIIAEGGRFGAYERTTFCVVENQLDLCPDYREIEFAPVTIEEEVNGFKLSASFETGLSEFTGFGISATPSATPGEINATVIQEQIEVNYTNKYDEAFIDYFIFEKYDESLGTWKELETVVASNLRDYTVIDYFPSLGQNRYRVVTLLSNGDKLMPCYEAEVTYNATTQIRLTPNPATDYVNIVLSDPALKNNVFVEIYNINGQLVVSDQLIAVGAVARGEIDITSLATGQYFVRLFGEDDITRDLNFVKVSD